MIVNPSDFSSSNPLAGVHFQQLWEEKAFLLGGGNFSAPVQTVKDFIAGIETKKLGAVTPSYLPDVRFANLTDCLPTFISETLREALPIFDRSVRGFAAPDAVLTGIEARSSSPVRIVRGSDFQAAIKGIYPCGEGAGYAGGISSAAIDGIKVAEAVATNN